MEGGDQKGLEYHSSVLQRLLKRGMSHEVIPFSQEYSYWTRRPSLDLYSSKFDWMFNLETQSRFYHVGTDYLHNIGWKSTVFGTGVQHLGVWCGLMSTNVFGTMRSFGFLTSTFVVLH
jgi:hypothetical protein